MNKYNFSPEAKSFLIKGFVVGLVIFFIGIALNWNVGHDTGHSEEHHADGVKIENTLYAEANTDAHVATSGEATASAHGEQATLAEEHGPTLRTHIISNVYTIALYAFWVGVAALFFLSACTLALGGWQIQIQKAILAIAGTLPFSILIMTIFFIFFNQDLFHWTHDLYNPNSPEYDAVLASKHDYLNLTRFGIFAVILFGLVLGLNYLWNKNLNAMDENPSVKLFDKSRAISAASIVIIAMLVNTFGSWDWAMSVQPHWYSTMFSWYLLASAAVGMFSILILIILYLKKNEYLPRVNENHRHDVAKYMFAITIFWTYVWFSQYMLMWYANIPEETIYFTKRLNGYPVLFYLIIVVNFVLPFLVLLTRNSKRIIVPVVSMAILIIVGHWLDFFTMIVPELIPNGGGLSLISLGAFITIGSAFIYITLNSLSKYKDLESSTHPYIQESYQHHI